MSLATISSRFEREYSRISARCLAEIERGIYNVPPSDVREYIIRIFRKYGYNEQVEKLALEYITRGAAFGISARDLAKPAVFRKVWLNKVYDASGVNFSSRINDLSRHDELIRELAGAMNAKKSWGMAAQNIFDKGIQQADVAKDVDNLLKQARKVYGIADDSEAYAAYKRQVRSVQRRIDKLVKPDKSTLKRAYQNILDVTNKSSKAAVERAAKYAGYFKEKYNTERLVNTEISRAYGQSRIVEMQADDDVVAVRSVLNSQHSIYDICDAYAEMDLYGMGEGVFPKNHMPPYPYHPWCQCKLEDVYIGEVQKKSGRDFDPQNGEKFLKSLSADERRSLLGARGSGNFERNPKTWQRELKGYHKPEYVTAKIPLEVLHGK